MNSRPKRRSGIGWSVSIAVLALILLINLFGGFNSTDGRIYDLFHSVTAKPVDDESILLVECAPAILEPGNPHIPQLLNTISQASPAIIGVVSERTSPQLSKLNTEPFGCPIVEGRPANSIGPNEPIPTGFSELTFTPQPVLRSADQQADNHRGPVDSFERQLAAKIGFFSDRQTIGIRFADSINSIPHISADRILNRKHLPQMIRDRIVIVGEKLPNSSAVYTPVSKNEAMSILEVRGHVVLSLIHGSAPEKTGLLTSFCCLVPFWLALCLLCRHVSPRQFPITAIAYCAVAVVTCFIAATIFSVSLPASALLMLASWIPFCIWLDRFGILSDIVASRKVKLNVDSISNSDLKLEDPFQRMAPALNQFYTTGRIALFEIVPETQMLRLVETDGSASQDSIHKQHSDISLDPWKQSIDFGRASRDHSCPIFKPLEPSTENAEVEDFASRRGDIEFIVPLKNGSKIFGFIVLEVLATDLQGWTEFEKVINEFADEFAGLIQQHRSAVAQQRSWGPKAFTPEQLESDAIQRKQNSVDEATNQIRKAFESDTCCRTLFDAHGRILQMNSRAIRRLDSDKPTSAFNFVELLKRFAGVDVSEARKIFRTAIVADQKSELATRLGSLGGTIVVSPIAWTDEQSRDLFSRGVLVEIFDAREITESPQITKEESLLQEVTELAQASAQVVQNQTDKSLDSVLYAAVFNAQPRLQKKNITLASTFENTPNIVLQNRELLTSATEVSLNVLADCSRLNDTLTFALNRHQTHWELVLRNGQTQTTTSWSSPSILGKPLRDQLEEIDKKMRMIAGSVEFEDTLNGEVMIFISFPVPNTKSTTGPSLATEVGDV